MKHFDFLIVGHGLAGTLLAHELQERNQKFLVINLSKANSASNVAIGLVNPITGKRLVKSWMIDELLPVSQSTYQTFEKRYQHSFYHATKIARIIPNEDIFNQWKPNFEIAVQEGFIDPNIQTIQLGKHEYPFFFILKSFWLDTKELLAHREKELKRQGILLENQFLFSKVKVGEEGYVYDNYIFQNIIFCEGYQAINNPFFPNLPFNLNKGEVIEANLPKFEFEDIIKKNIFLLPKENHTYRVGATYNREEVNEAVSKQAFHYFQDKIYELFGEANDVFLQHQQAGIRPATIDRRPIIGEHLEKNGLYLFNGFGAKGVSLIPYFAKHFTSHILDGKPLMKEVSISRKSVL